MVLRSRIRHPPFRNLLLNVPVLAGVMLFTSVGQVLLISSFPDMAATELAWVVLSIVCYSSLFTALAGVTGGVAAGAATRFVAALVWMVVLSAAFLYVANYAGYLWLGLNLHETLPLLVENIPSFQTTMRSKMTALIAVVLACIATFTAGTLAIRYGIEHLEWFRRPIAARRAIAWVGGLVLLLCAERVLAPRVLGLAAYNAKNRVLWQPEIYAPRHPAAPADLIELDAPRFRQVVSEAAVTAALSTMSPADVHRPKNVFFFIIDSLREDAITEDLAPNLHALKQRSLPVKTGVAASNVTHISWFSLLHAVNPFYWSVVAHQKHSRGAVPMRVLDKCGYRITALSCSSLDYFGVERSVFGDSPSLAAKVIDARTLFDPSTDRGEADVDEKLMARLNADIEQLQPDSRAFYLIVLDSTHHDYSWARRYQPKFTPFTERVSVFTTPSSEDVEPLRNRYRNAVNYVDMLFGEFVGTLEARGLLEHSIIAVTGDHGEEFFERGHLVHSGELNRFQTHTPILIAVPGAAAAPAANVAAHIDIFPTIFDALGLSPKTRNLFEGTSLLEHQADRAAFCAMASSYSPSEAILDGGDYKLLVDLEGVRKVGRTLFARRLVASRVVTREDEPTLLDAGEIRRRFRPALEKLIAGDLSF